MLKGVVMFSNAPNVLSDSCKVVVSCYAALSAVLSSHISQLYFAHCSRHEVWWRFSNHFSLSHVITGTYIF